MADKSTCKKCDLEDDSFIKNEDIKNVNVYTRDNGRCIYRGNMCVRHRTHYEVALNCSVNIAKTGGFIKGKKAS